MPHRTAIAHTVLLASLAGALSPAIAQTCKATSAAKVTPVVELYTSEGCNSCPPADRWLSSLKANPDMVALAFHVDYWDRLGWVDRFASPEFTSRQSQQQAVNGTRYSYTPQVVINGVDRRDWGGVAELAAVRPDASVRITLAREGDTISATVQSPSSARLAAYWAVTEDGHVTAVKAGENAGVTLKHDHVVRELRPVASWTATPDKPLTLQFRPTSPASSGHPREVNLVVVSGETGRPLQALKIGC